MLRRCLLHSLLAALLIPPGACADDHTAWNGQAAAVALTYDDAIDEHLDNVIPELDRYGFKGTFYIPVSFPAFGARLAEWRRAAAAGHELGNHTLFHPCRTDMDGREWVSPDRDLSAWSVERIAGNIEVANLTLRAADGRQERTFAYPCGDTTAGGDSYVESIRPEFAGARGVTDEIQPIGEIDPFNVGAHMVMNDSADRLTALVDEAIDRYALVVFLFHGVGGGHDINVAKENHDALLKYLDQKREAVWVAPMVDIVKYVKTHRQSFVSTRAN